ncbi:oxygen-independent coproporphyrinogen-3 oxidase [Pilibacter termitis]|uniref:Heme chaperone HemW n=1 Tax=Pilibacter termitis TaxID=263852 RepID=A0A1T4Q1S8_9ENTE|nr:radical SAM family heme chaperone HemW [Pilibacter termitis]SJZ97178.1 oxygen-independent coproporphyrinogen-3 oxidase [Pilibacter termitis]
MPNNKKISAYLHIPFCEHICYYCDFNKVFLEGQPVDEYIQLLLKEIALTQESYPVKEIPTIYIGGGTPSSLSAKQLEVLLDGVRTLLPYHEEGEFTMEANPGDLTAEKMSVMKSFGVNRISLGVQTFDNRLLKKIGRKHTAEQVFETVNLLKQQHFENISLDLIYALPTQTMESLDETLDLALSLDLPHYSLYSLILENKTQFMNWVRKGKLELPNEDVQADMFARTIEKMNEKKLFQYEISNFAKAGFESKHNLVYWNNEHYYGFGAGASGYLENVRLRNHGPIQHYMTPLRKGELPILEKEHLTRENQMEEEMFLGLRKRSGISKKKFSEKFNVSFEEIYGEVTRKLIQQGLIEEKEGFLVLTERGLYVGNTVFEEFLLLD